MQNEDLFRWVNNWVPSHKATSRLRVKLATPIWRLLPSRTQRWLCGCPTCRGTS